MKIVSTICIKCQDQFSGKNEKNISMLSAENFIQSAKHQELAVYESLKLQILMALIVTTLWVNSADDKSILLFLFFPEYMIRHFIPAVSLGSTYFLAKIFSKCCLLKFLPSLLSIKDGGLEEHIRNFDVTPGGKASGVWPRRVQSPFCRNIVMLHIKSKIMKSRIQWCKEFARGHVWGSLEVKK